MLPARPNFYQQIPNGGDATPFVSAPALTPEEIEPARVRARHEDGTFREDDPSTPEDEAWEEVPAE